jgi:lipid-A-disaccharide synthase
MGVAAEVRVGHEAKWQAFVEADAALAASGTVILELALAGVPCASVYRMDWLSSTFLFGMIEAWTGALPNLIADRVVVPDHYERFFRPQYHARLMAGLIDPASPQHAAQQAGYCDVQAAVTTKNPAAEIAAGRVLALASGGTQTRDAIPT